MDLFGLGLTSLYGTARVRVYSKKWQVSWFSGLAPISELTRHDEGSSGVKKPSFLSPLTSTVFLPSQQSGCEKRTSSGSTHSESFGTFVRYQRSHKIPSFRSYFYFESLSFSSAPSFFMADEVFFAFSFPIWSVNLFSPLGLFTLCDEKVLNQTHCKIDKDWNQSRWNLMGILLE